MTEPPMGIMSNLKLGQKYDKSRFPNSEQFGKVRIAMNEMKTAVLLGRCMQCFRLDTQ